jgi:hypothetical protein
MRSDTLDGRYFREVIAEEVSRRSRDARIEISRLIQHHAGHQVYRYQIFPLSEGACLHAEGMIERGMQGQGSNGFLFSPK